ncbi:MAG: dockerin type I repeat-containing protein [Chthonomonas sp.]|nr:dockerin type I repeat-containing protein [Chthonomonas sp.]
MKRIAQISLGLLVAAAASAQVSFTENFDSYIAGDELGTQGGWQSGTFNAQVDPISITDLFSVSPNNSAYTNLWFRPAATGAFAWQYIGHDPSMTDGSMDFSYSFMISEDGSRNDTVLANLNLNKVLDGSGWMTLQFQSSGTPGYDDSLWMIDTVGNFSYVGNTGGNPTNTWHNVRGRYNSTNGNLTLWFNGQMSYRTYFSDPARVGWMNMMSYAFVPNALQETAFDDISFNSKPTTTVAGTVQFQGMTDTLYDGYIFWIQASFWSGTTKVDEAAGYVDIDGNLTMDCSLPDGVYTAYFDGWYGLRRSATVTVLGGSCSVNLVLPNGDCDSSGIIDIADYTIIASAFDALVDDGTGNPTPTWNYDADINGDGVIDIADYSLLAGNFDSVDTDYPS